MIRGIIIRVRHGIECKKEASVYIRINNRHYYLEEFVVQSRVTDLGKGYTSDRLQPMQKRHVNGGTLVTIFVLL